MTGVLKHFLPGGWFQVHPSPCSDTGDLQLLQGLQRLWSFRGPQDGASTRKECAELFGSNNKKSDYSKMLMLEPSQGPR